MSEKCEVIVGDTVYMMNRTTYSKTERTIFDWDSDYMAEFRMECAEAVETFIDSSDIRLRVNEHGDLVYPPVAPKKPKTDNWKRMTPKRQGILAQYRADKAQYIKEMGEWLELPLLNDGESSFEKRFNALKERPPLEETGVFEYPCGRWHRGFGGNERRELPYHLVEHHQMEIVEPVEGESWLKQDILDIAYRKAMVKQRLKEKRQSRSKFKKSQEDSTVQVTLTGNCFNEREVTGDMLHNFTGDAELMWKFFINSFKVIGCIHGSVDIINSCFVLTKEELDEVYRMRG